MKLSLSILLALLTFVIGGYTILFSAPATFAAVDCSINARAGFSSFSPNTFNAKAMTNITFDYFSGFGHVQMWISNLNGQPMYRSDGSTNFKYQWNYIPTGDPAQDAANTVYPETQAFGLYGYNLGRCDNDSGYCTSYLGQTLNNVPAGRYLLYCDVIINSNQYGVREACTGSPFCDQPTNLNPMISSPKYPGSCQYDYGYTQGRCGDQDSKFLNIYPDIKTTIPYCDNGQPRVALDLTPAGNLTSYRITRTHSISGQQYVTTQNYNRGPAYSVGEYYYDTTVANDTRYIYQITGYTSSGEAIDGSTVSVDTRNCTLPTSTPTFSPPACYDGVFSGGSGTVSWTGQSSNGQGFYVDISTDYNFSSWSSKYVPDNGSGSHSTTMDGFSPQVLLQPNTNYFVRVWNFNAHSPTGSIGFGACAPIAPSTPVVNCSTYCSGSNAVLNVGYYSGMATWYTVSGVPIPGTYYTNYSSYANQTTSYTPIVGACRTAANGQTLCSYSACTNTNPQGNITTATCSVSAPTIPTGTASYVCNDWNTAQVTYSWSGGQPNTGYSIVDEYGGIWQGPLNTTATSITYNNVPNGNRGRLLVYSINSSTGQNSPPFYISNNVDCGFLSSPTVTTTKYCSGPLGRQGQIAISWSFDARAQEWWAADTIVYGNWTPNLNNYIVNTPNSANIGMIGLARRTRPWVYAPYLQLDSVWNNKFYAYNPQGALLYSSGGPWAYSYTTAPNCSPPVVTQPTLVNGLQSCQGVNQPRTVLSWAPVPDTYYYEIYSPTWAPQYPASGGWAPMGSLTSYDWYWGANNASYSFQVRAYKNTAPGSDHTFSDIVNFTNPDCSPPATPQWSVDSPTLSTNAQCAVPPYTPWFDLSWQTAARADSYELRKNGVLIPAWNQPNTIYRDSGLSRNTPYTYSVTACRTLPGSSIRVCSNPTTYTQTTPWCDTVSPQVQGVSQPPGQCYDPSSWGASRVFQIAAQDRPPGTNSGIAAVVVRLQITSGGAGAQDIATTYNSATGTYDTPPIPLNQVYIPNRYTQFQILTNSVDNAGNGTGFIPAPGPNGTYTFYTQPSCAEPFIQTQSGSVHSNEGINVPPPPSP